MTKWKSQRKVVGSENMVRRPLAKPLEQKIILLQISLQKKEDQKKKPKKISFLYASLEFSRRLD